MIIADKREKNSLVIAELLENKAQVEIKHLKVADYVLGDIAIERKTVNDFISSMLSKRLLRQLQELKQYPKQLLIIEGLEEQELYNDEAARGLHPNAIRGMLLSILLKFQVPIIFTKDYKDTARFLLVLEKKLSKPEQEVSLKVKKKTNSLQEQQQLVLESFPGIGPKTAKALLKKFKTIKSIINASLEELVKAKLNKKKAETMKKIIETKYQD
ncbi:MAG: ERCC4 domain-containing protein [Candidatus Pacearchaeota archaeon]